MHMKLACADFQKDSEKIVIAFNFNSPVPFFLSLLHIQKTMLGRIAVGQK